MKIRPATPADVPALQAIERHAATAAHWSEADYARLFAAEPRRLALVIEEKELLGFLVARPVGDEWELENIAVTGPARRRGMGASLLGHFLDLARRQGARTVFLEVRESNRAARALYEKWAFTESDRRKTYYRDPAEDAVVYRFVFPE
jgi:ribosomal-protein-alanine N-acetyltransferase